MGGGCVPGATNSQTLPYSPCVLCPETLPVQAAYCRPGFSVRVPHTCEAVCMGGGCVPGATNSQTLPYSPCVPCPVDAAQSATGCQPGSEVLVSVGNCTAVCRTGMCMDGWVNTDPSNPGGSPCKSCEQEGTPNTVGCQAGELVWVSTENQCTALCKPGKCLDGMNNVDTPSNCLGLRALTWGTGITECTNTAKNCQSKNTKYLKAGKCDAVCAANRCVPGYTNRGVDGTCVKCHEVRNCQSGKSMFPFAGFCAGAVCLANSCVAGYTNFGAHGACMACTGVLHCRRLKTAYPTAGQCTNATCPIDMCDQGFVRTKDGLCKCPQVPNCRPDQTIYGDPDQCSSPRCPMGSCDVGYTNDLEGSGQCLRACDPLPNCQAGYTIYANRATCQAPICLYSKCVPGYTNDPNGTGTCIPCSTAIAQTCTQDALCLSFDLGTCVGGKQRCTSCPLGKVLNGNSTACIEIQIPPYVYLAAISSTNGTVSVGWLVTNRGPTIYPPFKLYKGGIPTGALFLLKEGILVNTSGSLNMTNDATSQFFCLIDSRRTVVATTRVHGYTHPRIALHDSGLARLRNLYATSMQNSTGIPAQTFKSISKRLDFVQWDKNGTTNLAKTGYHAFAKGGTGEQELRLARESAFWYLLTGNTTHADRAYIVYMQAKPKTYALMAEPDSQEIDIAIPFIFYATVYDWAYNAWTPEQRRNATLVIKDGLNYFLTRTRNPALTREEKGNNWVGVVRGAELYCLLAASGDSEVDLGAERVAWVMDQLRRYLDTSYTSTGWNQEGWDYMSYALQNVVDITAHTEYAGFHGLSWSFRRLNLANLLLHTQSIRQDLSRSQWGPGLKDGAIYFIPHMFAQVSPSDMPYFLWLYERTFGYKGSKMPWGGTNGLIALIHWPMGVTAVDPDNYPQATTASMDDVGGAYFFRNRYQDVDDVIVGATNRNRGLRAWGGSDSFAMSIIGGDTHFAIYPGKANMNISELYSKPLIDRKYESRSSFMALVVKGKTLYSTPYAGQHGGYSKLEASVNFNVTVAERELSVDMREGNGVDAVIAVKDVFADNTSHLWSWQIAPDVGVNINPDTVGVNGVLMFTLMNGTSFLRGWMVKAKTATPQTLAGTTGPPANTNYSSYMISSVGTNATFRIVMAIGKGTPPTATIIGNRVTINGVTYDTDNLSNTWPVARGFYTPQGWLYYVTDSGPPAKVCQKYGMALAAVTSANLQPVIGTITRHGKQTWVTYAKDCCRACTEAQPRAYTLNPGGSLRYVAFPSKTNVGVLCAR